MKNKGEELAAILTNFKDCHFFLHNTKDLITVENIVNEGFIFERQLSHSTDLVNPHEPIEITYFLFQRKEYGIYTVIIAIPRAIYEIYSGISNSSNTGIEDIICTSDPYYGENDELIYTLSPKHILGYFNNRTSEFYPNKKWDPFYNNYQERHPGNKYETTGSS
jgi:hypothetical protein